MAFFNKASPALKEILLKLYSAEKPMEIDHQIFEFGSVQYHIRASASEPHRIHLSVSTALQSPGVPITNGLQNSTIWTLKRIYSDVVEIVEPPEEGYQLTLSIQFSKLPQRKEKCLKIITDIASLQALILSSQLKEMLWILGSRDSSHGNHNQKPIKLVYHPGEPFFVIRLPEKTTVIFPMRFKEDSDVIIATGFFQELMDVGCSGAFTKAPQCTWSPIPPPELRGEPFQDLSTNGGFVSFDLYSRRLKGSKMDKTVWNLLNFYAYVKYHVKCTRGFIQRRMRKKVELLAEILQKAAVVKGDEHVARKSEGHGRVNKLNIFSKSKMLRRKCLTLVKKIRKIRYRIKIQGFDKFRGKWLRVPRFYSWRRRYTKLE